MTTQITLRAEARACGGDTESGGCTVHFSYNPTDPYVVSLRVGEATWVLSREVLAAGMTEPTGACDVFVTPFGGGDTIVLTLHAPDGTSTLTFCSGRTLAAFLRVTHREVPAGSESGHLDLDGCINRILEEEDA